MRTILISLALVLGATGLVAAEGVYTVEFARLGGAGVSTLYDANIEVAYYHNRFTTSDVQSSVHYETELVLSYREYLLPVDLAEFTLE